MEKQENYREAFMANLKTLMHKNNITQQKLADAVGLKRQTIALYESGAISPKLENIVAIAKYFNVSCDYLSGVSRAQSLDGTVQNFVNMYGLEEKPLEVLSFIVETPEGEEDMKALDALNIILSNYGFFVPFFDLIYDNLFLESDDNKIKFECRVSERGNDNVRDEDIYSRSLDANMYKELQIKTLYRYIEALRLKLSHEDKIEIIKRPIYCNVLPSLEELLKKLDDEEAQDKLSDDDVVETIKCSIMCNAIPFIEEFLDELNDDTSLEAVKNSTSCNAVPLIEALLSKLNDEGLLEKLNDEFLRKLLNDNIKIKKTLKTLPLK